MRSSRILLAIAASSLAICVGSLKPNPRRRTALRLCQPTEVFRGAAFAVLLLLGLMLSPFVRAQQYSVTVVPPAAGQSTAPIGTALNSSGMVTGLIGALPGAPAVGSAYFGYPDSLQPGPDASLFQYSPGTTVNSVGTTLNLGSYNPLGPSGYLCNSYVSYPTVGFAINASGEIAGAACASSESPAAFFYQSGAFTLIGPAQPSSSVLGSWGLAINSSGQIAGTLVMTGSAGSGSCPGNPYHSFVFNSSTSGFQDLGTLGGCSSTATAINDSGEVAGTVWDNEDNPHGYIYSNGTTTTFDLFDCPNNDANYAARTHALAINASGQVTGQSQVGCDQGTHAFLYSPSTGIQDIGTLGGADGAQGNSINSSGQVTGLSYTSGDAAVHAFLYTSGPLVDLNSLLSSADAAQYTLEDGVAINDAGQILVLAAENATGQQVTLLLTPAASVPNVVGDTQAAATSALTGAGFALGNVTTQASTSVAPGIVISQNPSAGTSATAGSAVDLVVSSGVTVPNVVGVPLASATAVLTSAGLTTGAISQQYSSTVPQGNVISESPAAGSSVVGGTAVGLVISEGYPPVLVPNVVDETQTAATAALNSAGLVLGSVMQQASSTVPQGEVLSQSPPAGNSVTVGSAVNLTLSSGPPQVSIVLATAPQFTYNGSAWEVVISLKNNGNVTATIQLNSASLNGISTLTPGLTLEDLAAGAGGGVLATFPATVTSGTLKLSGTYTAGTLTGNWSVSARVAVPAIP